MRALGFDAAAGGDEVFRCLVLARIIEPTSKFDSLRVQEETGIGPTSLVLYDVSTLYFDRGQRLAKGGVHESPDTCG